MHYVNTIIRILQTIVILEWISYYEIKAYIHSPNERMHRSYAVRRVMPDLKSKHQNSPKSNHNQPPLRRWHNSHHHHFHQPQHKHNQKRRSYHTQPHMNIHHKTHSHSIQYYSEFSEWSHCDLFCKKKRERECMYPVVCGNTKQIEEKPCDPKYCKPLQMQILGYDYYDHEMEMEKKKKKEYYSQVEDIQYHLEEEEEMPLQIEEEHHHHHYYGKGGHSDGEFGSSNQYEHRVKRPNNLFEPIPVNEPQNDEEYAILAHNEKLKKQNAFTFDINGFSDQQVLDSSNEPVHTQLQQAHLANIVNSYQSLQPTTTEMPNFSVFENKFTDINEPYFDFYKTVSPNNSSSSWKPTLSPSYSKIPKNIRMNYRSSYQSPMPRGKPIPQPRGRRRRHRFKREALYDDKEIDEDYEYDQFNNTEIEKKYPGEDMLKIGNGGRKKSREKAVFEVPKKYENHYTKWSRWSKCTAKCTTRRFKRCKIKPVCGSDIIREIAYCYTEGSFCEEWITTQMRGGNNAITDPKPMKPVKTAIAARRSDMSNSISSGGYFKKGFLQAEYRPQHFQCGISSVRNKSGRSMYHMLRIIGGKTAKKGQWPWQVVILNRFKEAFCGGTLVSPLWILTAAHCVRKRLYVRLGEHNLQQNDGTEIEYRIETSIKHPKYDKKTVDNDVAMLRLPEEMVTSNFVGFACLPERYQQLPVSQTCTIIGWGKKRHSDDAGTNILHEAEVPIITNDECRNVYHDYTITKNMFCAGHKRGRVDTCAGDSGGPLLCKDNSKANNPWTIFGITSFGDGCGKKNKFGIYSKLPNYVDWIWSVINCNGNCLSYN